MIRRRSIPLPILREDRHSIETATQGTETQKPKTYTIPLLKLWRITRQECIRGDDATNVTEADLPRCAHGATVVAPEIHVEPADYHGHGGVGAHSDEEES